MSELVVQTSDLVAPSTLFGTDNPGEVVERAAGVARTLAEVVHKQNLVVRIGQSNHVRVEGWTFLGSLLGVFPVVEWTRPVMDGDAQVGWEARVEARTRSGEVVGAAEAECLRSENTWKSRDDYALRSMAQTRAVSKALRLPLGFVMQLAGFNPTPAEEMPTVESRAVRAEDDRQFPPVNLETGEIIESGSAAVAEPGVNKTAGTDVTAEAEPIASGYPGSATAAEDVPIATKAQQGLILAKAREAGLDDDARHALTEAITGQPSSKLVPKALVNDVLAEIAKHAEGESSFAARAEEAIANRQESLTP